VRVFPGGMFAELMSDSLCSYSSVLRVKAQQTKHCEPEVSAVCHVSIVVYLGFIES